MSETKRRGRPPKDAQDVNPPAVVEDVLEAPRATGAIPPCPEMDPMAGDKTPAVVAWWFKYHPKEAAAKYQGRKFQLPADYE